MTGAIIFRWAALAMVAASPAGAAPIPHRIVSVNLCSDQLVLALADRNQIAGLSHNAIDPEISAEAARARNVHIMGESAEEVIALHPDLIVGMPLPGGGAMALLTDQHYATLDLKDANSYPEILAAIRTTARAVGHPDRGEALIARMDADLAHIGRPGQGRVAAYYQRRGYLTGTGTLIDALMTRVGLINLAARLHKPALAQVSLEEMIAAHPDLLIVESATDDVTDRGTEMLHHPVLANMKRISIPQAWTVCGGPAYVKAAQAIAAALNTDRSR